MLYKKIANDLVRKYDSTEIVNPVKLIAVFRRVGED